MQKISVIAMAMLCMALVGCEPSNFDDTDASSSRQEQPTSVSDQSADEHETNSGTAKQLNGGGYAEYQNSEPGTGSWQQDAQKTDARANSPSPAPLATPQSYGSGSSTFTNMALGGVIGYMLGSSGSSSAPSIPAPQVAPRQADRVNRIPASTAPTNLAVASHSAPSVTRPAPAPVSAPKPAVASAPAKPTTTAQPSPAPRPSYSGPSGYSSVRQAAPTYKQAPSPSPSRSGGRR